MYNNNIAEINMDVKIVSSAQARKSFSGLLNESGFGGVGLSLPEKVKP